MVGISSPGMSGAEIKALYEAEVNAYTDTKDTKLAGIAEGADVGDMPKSTYDPDTDGRIDITDTKNFFKDLTVAMGQAITVTGNCTDPTYANNNNYTNYTVYDAIPEYVEFDFLVEVHLKQFRIRGYTGNAVGDRLKIQIFNRLTDAWEDWKTDIGGLNVTDWTAWTNGDSEVVTQKVRIISVAIGGSYLRISEIELKN